VNLFFFIVFFLSGSVFFIYSDDKSHFFIKQGSCGDNFFWRFDHYTTVMLISQPLDFAAEKSDNLRKMPEWSCGKQTSGDNERSGK